ncbi:ATP-dependent DNA helicase [Streptomyces profundus]|uniref:ATP-dependent DNA helicase n=1 Tax=Streptomyces profundus TaxID=2867410 RepID=UPI001D16501A|nr:ATP-dependent DNA helicase [Streptomyces sp. MA3_2.13]UED84310.1 ATP-dependent helicase [Streptomyces sp. MA3_2.13]
MPAPLSDPRQLSELLGIPFTPEQLACATAPAAPQAIVAGAGSGKTTVMAARVVWLTGTGRIAPDRVLGLTFTNKAAGELAERVRTALAKARIDTSETGEPTISTYHAFAGRLLTEHGLRLGIEPASRLLADAGRFQLAAEVLRGAPADFEPPSPSFTTLVTDLVALDGELSEHLVPPERLRSFDGELLAELAEARLTNAALRQVPRAAEGRLALLGLVEEYRARKRARDLLDFGDQIALAAALARERPEVGQALREQFGVVLLDEYQDTSVAQRVLLAGLFGDGTGHPVTAVGDPCQGIYGWRGASVANLDDFPEHFAAAEGVPARVLRLSQNRRSGGRLLTLANALAAPLRERHPSVAPLRPAEDAEGAGLVRCALLPTHAEELAWLADAVAHQVRTGTEPGEIAVLCRTASDFPLIQSALVARDVPVEVVGLSGLLHLPEVADLVAVCEVLADPTANAALVRLLTGPRWRIGPRDLALLGRRARLLVRRVRAGEADAPGGEAAALARLADAVAGTDPAEVVSLADALDTFVGSGGGSGADPGSAEPDDRLPFSPEARVRFAHLAAELRDLRRSLGDPLMDVLHRVLTHTGLDVELSASPMALAARRRETLGAFLDVAASFAAGRAGTAVHGDATLSAFLGFLRAAESFDRGLDGSLPSGGNAVQVLTAHKAKGLEWDVVAVPGLCAGLFPAVRSRDSWLRQARTLPHPLRGDAETLPPTPEWTAAGYKRYLAETAGELELEELRLGYVAVTRPRRLLLGSGHWWGPSQKKRRGPSDFLTALREHCERDPGHGEVEHWAEPPPEEAENPALARDEEELAWPLPLDSEALARRREAALAVLSRLHRMPSPRPDEPDGTPPDDEPPPDEFPPDEPPPDEFPPDEPSPDGLSSDELTPEERRTMASWDRDLTVLASELRQARAGVREVPLPVSLSATQLQRLATDPDGFARELARPMPRPPQPAARRGTRFHAWVESRFDSVPLPMLGPEELPGGDPDEDAEIRDERELAALKQAFQRTPYADRRPYRIEAPFQLTLAGRVIRGRIDAVYRLPPRRGSDSERWEIIDWKTARRQDADPLQLAIYRLAWAERHQLPLSEVTAAFLYVRSGELVRPSVLPGRRGLERLLMGEDSWEPNDPG